MILHPYTIEYSFILFYFNTFIEKMFNFFFYFVFFVYFSRHTGL